MPPASSIAVIASPNSAPRSSGHRDSGRVRPGREPQDEQCGHQVGHLDARQEVVCTVQDRLVGATRLMAPPSDWL